MRRLTLGDVGIFVLSGVLYWGFLGAVAVVDTWDRVKEWVRRRP